MQVGGPFYLLGNGESSQNSGVDLVGALDMAATTLPPATAQQAALSEGERHGLAACLVKCADGDKVCVNRCMSQSQTKGIAWSDATRACIRACRIQNAAKEVIFGCVSGCLDRMRGSKHQVKMKNRQHPATDRVMERVS
jgi:hypothetical protein